MKKTIILLCTLFVLLLAACDKAPENAGTESGKAAQSTEAGVGSNGSGPDTVESTNPVNPEPYVLKVAPEDKPQCSNLSGLLETSEGYYKPQQTEKSSLVYFCPRGGDTFRPLCGKPNCKHADENCNAWVGYGFDVVLGYYNGALYALDYHELNVIKINPDGTDHQVVATVDFPDIEKYGFSAFFHHGRLFIFFHANYDLPLEEQVDHLMVLDLSDGSQRELAADYFRASGLTPYPNSFRGDKVYIMEENPENGDENSGGHSLIEVDAVTGEVRTVIPHYVNGLYVTDSTLYYFEQDLTRFGIKDKVENPGFREYDVESGTVKDCGLPAEDILFASYDDDHIYADSFQRNNYRDMTLYFLSRDYELLDKLELTDYMLIYEITSDRIFFCDANDVYRRITHYIDKSKIGTGELELIPIKTVG